jgi:hypothetical protein
LDPFPWIPNYIVKIVSRPRISAPQYQWAWSCFYVDHNVHCDALAHYIQRSVQVDLVFHFKVLPSAMQDRHAILPGDKLIKLWARCFELSHLFSADADRSLWSQLTRLPQRSF